MHKSLVLQNTQNIVYQEILNLISPVSRCYNDIQQGTQFKATRIF